KIAAPTDRWAIDGTVLTLDNNTKYFMWSGWEGFENIRQNLYIAPMSNAWSISGERVCISTPEYRWEKVGAPYVNEAPQILKNDRQIYIIYSASGSWTDDYCLGQLTYVGGNVLKNDSWVKNDKPVFSKTDKVFGPGHACFLKSPDEKENWIVYHAAKHSGAGWNRNVRSQKFSWNTDGSPNFGTPIPAGIPVK
ncbi:MAG: glycoside hydrolase family 43 protein, partial [Acidobacteriota bacterium]|nr:glycoside hydrolase family 43 protein [Acidobacteriota bacterium]